MIRSQHIRVISARLKETAAKPKDKEGFSLDEIVKLVRPICQKLAKCKTDEAYSSALDSYGSNADVIDDMFTDDVHYTADKIHYHQKLDDRVAKLLKSL